MRRPVFAVLAVFFFAAASRAHMQDIHATRVFLKADGDVLRSRVEATALPWFKEVGAGHGGNDWSVEDRERSLAYLRKRLPVSVDDQVLAPRLTGIHYARDPWDSDFTARVIFDLTYDLPREGRVLTLKPALYQENWDEVEGENGGKSPEGVPRDFRTFVRWSYRPGALVLSDIRAPGASIPLDRLRRGDWERALESVFTAWRAFFQAGGVPCLFLALLFFPPDPRTARAGLLIAVPAAIAGGFALRGLPVAHVEKILWAAVASAGAASMARRPAFFWLPGLFSGAPAAARLLAATGAALKDATAFSGFSWEAFWIGTAAFLAAGWGARFLFIFLYTRRFRYLSPDEFARAALFHRSLVSRLLAIAGLYWVLSPFWTGVP